MKEQQLTEFFDSRDSNLSVDAEQGVIKGVKLLGSASRNGRDYPKETIARAAALYEGARVNVDHPRGEPGSPRSYADRLGVIRNVRLEQGQGGLRGDLHANPRHRLYEQLAWDAQHSPASVGFSHNVLAKTRTHNGRVVVEEITRVKSVDLVADPATTRGLFEQQDEPGKERGIEVKEITLEQLRSDRPDLVTAISEAAVEGYKSSEEVEAIKSRVKELEEQVDRYEAEKTAATHAAAVEQQIAEAKLPEELVTDVFRRQLIEAADAEARTAIIEDRAALAKQIGTVKPQSKEQQPLKEGTLPGVTDAKSAAQFLTRG
jgi:hypothetical protein